MSASRAIVQFRDVDIVFGDKPESALPLIDVGKDRAEIQRDTGQVLGVAGCSLDIHEGEIVVLMGLSGSGKSTLLRAVNGLNPVIRGQALVAMDDELSDFADPQTCGAKRLRHLRQQRVAMVFQQFGLLPWRSVRDNVGFGLEISGVPANERARRVDEQLALVGLADWGDRQVGELSGGMQQRVGLARAFATQAPILLMDEPFSALDPLIRDKLQDDLLALQAEMKRTIIFVSHDLDEALKIGNRIAIMEGGRIIQVGTAQEIILDPATDYVAEFVAHMNPLSVLRAAEIVKRAKTVRKRGAVRLSDAALKAGAHIIVPLETPVATMMDLLVATGEPLLVEDQHGEVVGTIAMDDVVKALNRGN
ncbi:MAG: choline ABC transporter ATP-binding protein [Ahrensia sp.]|nr:choline ABC transporter ATP-binding protein [Ahrensia sp.]